MHPVAIIQARMGSSRLAGKVLRPILKKPLLWHIVHRLKTVKQLKSIVIATSDQPGDKQIRKFCENEGITFFAGSEEDVLDRIYKCAKLHGANPVVRITGDCPLVDPNLVEKLILLYASKDYDHVGIATGAGARNHKEGRFPDGLDTECTAFNAIEKAWNKATERSDREHVTPYIWLRPKEFRLGEIKSRKDYSNFRWTIDNEIDFRLIENIYEALFRQNSVFGMDETLSYLETKPEIKDLNKSMIGKEGYDNIWHSYKKNS